VHLAGSQAVFETRRTYAAGGCAERYLNGASFNAMRVDFGDFEGCCVDDGHFFVSFLRLRRIRSRMG
jgi:hypothetical protein